MTLSMNQYATGNYAIDSEHDFLYDCIMGLAALPTKPGLENLYVMMAQHFENEQLHMAQFDCPFLDVHTQDHIAHLHMIDTMLDRDLITSTTVGKLKDYFLQHVEQHDLPCAKWLTTTK